MMALSEKGTRQKHPFKQWWMIALVAIPISIATFIASQKGLESDDQIEDQVVAITEPPVVFPTASEADEIALIAALSHWNDTMPRLTLFDFWTRTGTDAGVLAFAHEICRAADGGWTMAYFAFDAIRSFPDDFEFQDDYMVMADSSIFYLCPEYAGLIGG